MHISFDTSTATTYELRGIITFLQSLLPAAVIAPADNPSTGTEPPVTTGIDIDAEGLPWDERIHASTKSKTSKGIWTSRRGANDAEMIQRVKAELTSTLALPPGAPAQLTIPMPVFPPAVTLPPALPTPPQNLAELMTWAGPMLAQGTMAPDAINNAAQQMGLPGLTGLAMRNDLVPTVFALLNGSGRG